MKSLNVIGCGKLGRVIARLMVQRGVVGELFLVNRSIQSAEAAQQFIGAGRVCSTLEDLPAADLWMISASDSEIDSIAHRLAQLHSVGEGQIIYHCSGAIESSVLCHLRLKGVSVAGVHPIRSFAEPSTAYESFPGTYCAMEGDADAKQALRVLYESIGAEVFEIAPLMKLVCHAGHVFASNYVVAVLDIARSLYRVAGIPDDVSRRFMDGIVRGTVANVSALGVERALTGPVVRGEVSVVHDQLNRLAELSSPWHECDAVALYAKLGEVALSIAQRRGELDVATLDALRALLVAHGATDKKKGAEPATRLPVAS